jgi:hypothetical protein
MMPFSESHFKTPSINEGIVDLRPPEERNIERPLDTKEKTEMINSTAQTALSRMEMIKAQFQALDLKHDTLNASHLIEESRYWIESLNAQHDFITNYRDETGNETAFEQPLTAIVVAIKDAKTILESLSTSAGKRHQETSDEEDELHIPMTVVEETPKLANDIDVDLASLNQSAEKERAKLLIARQEPETTAFVNTPEAANDNAIKHEKAELSPSPIIPVGEGKPKIASEFIDIPSSFEETQSKYAVIARMTKEIDERISRFSFSKEEADQFSERLFELSRHHAALEERLSTLQGKDLTDSEVIDEKAVIADALHMIEDARHKIREMPYNPKTPREQIHREMEIKKAELKKLEEVSTKLIEALKNTGIEKPELYFAEQSSGLGSIRRGIIKLFGRKERIINPTTLTKLRNEATKAVNEYFSNAYDQNEQLLPGYKNAREQNAILHLNEDSDAHDLWEAINQAIDRTEHEIKAHEDELGIISRDQQQIGNADNEIIRYSSVRTANQILESLTNDERTKDLSFSPKDYVIALTELRNTTTQRDQEKIENLLPKVTSMRDEIAENWISMANAQGENLVEDETVINEAREALKPKKSLARQLKELRKQDEAPTNKKKVPTKKVKK